MSGYFWDTTLVLLSCGKKTPVEPLPLDWITDLQIVATSTTAITLEWTAPEAQGEGLLYDARYVTSLGDEDEMTPAIWDIAMHAEGEPPPSSPGTDESLEVGGLVPGRGHFVAIRIGRATGEMSDISNTVSATTDNCCETPYLAIPDYDEVGITDTLTFPVHIEVGDVEVYVDITHTYIGDLFVDVTSPDGTLVRLHAGSGSWTNNIIGWYDSQLEVDGHGSLDDFNGEDAFGDWIIDVADFGVSGIGTLNEWCVRVNGQAP